MLIHMSVRKEDQLHLVRETIPISPQIEERLRDVARLKGDDIDSSKVAVQCLELLHNLNGHWRAGRQLFKENEPLHLPQPTAINLPAIHELRLNVYQPQQASLNQVCAGYRIDKQSALSWALDCLQIIEEALMTHRIYAGQSALWHPIKVSWIHKQTSS